MLNEDKANMNLGFYPIPKECLNDDEIIIMSKEQWEKIKESHYPLKLPTIETEWKFIDGRIVYEVE